MRIVISYDVEPDRTRTRIAKLLKNYGERVQKSVFECDLEETELDGLVNRLQKTLGKAEDGNIRVYKLCQTCWQMSFGLGGAVLLKEKKGFDIF